MRLLPFIVLVALCAAGCTAASASDPRAPDSHRPVRRSASCVWRRVAVPDLAPGFESSLVGVAAPAERSAWAVGDYFSGHEGGRSGSVVEHWDGSRWVTVHPAILRGVLLESVAATSSRDVWIAGAANGSGHGAFVAHWNGQTWARAQLPFVSGSSIVNDITALSARNVWAVGFRARNLHGQTLVFHWDGHRWKIVPSPSPPPRDGRRSRVRQP